MSHEIEWIFKDWKDTFASTGVERQLPDANQFSASLLAVAKVRTVRGRRESVA